MVSIKEKIKNTSRNMNKLEISVSLLQQILLKEIAAENLLSETDKILSVFEKIYLKVSELEEKISEDESENNLLLAAVRKNTIKSDSWENFQQAITEEITRQPEIFECFDCTQEDILNFKNSFQLSEREWFSLVSAGRCKVSGTQSCPKGIVKLELKSADSWGEYKRTLDRRLGREKL